MLSCVTWQGKMHDTRLYSLVVTILRWLHVVLFVMQLHKTKKGILSLRQSIISGLFILTQTCAGLPFHRYTAADFCLHCRRLYRARQLMVPVNYMYYYASMICRSANPFSSVRALYREYEIGPIYKVYYGCDKLKSAQCCTNHGPVCKRSPF